MTDKKSNESRRKLLKSIAAGSGVVIAGKSLPESWSKPIVDSVMLPAHAETSPSANLTGSYTATLYVENNSGGVDGNLLDTLIPTAHAVDHMIMAPWHFCINVTDGHAEVQATNEHYEGIWTASSYLPFHKVKMKNEIKGDPSPLYAMTAVWDPVANQLNCKAGISGCCGPTSFIAKSVPDGGKCQLKATVI
jgi:hypothetical protein